MEGSTRQSGASNWCIVYNGEDRFIERKDVLVVVDEVEVTRKCTKVNIKSPKECEE